MNSGSEMVEAKHVSGKNIYWSTFIGKSKERKFFDFLHCPFEPPAKQHRPVCQLGWILWCMIARPSKGQCRNSNFFPLLHWVIKVGQNISFPKACFTYSISDSVFTMYPNRQGAVGHLSCTIISVENLLSILLYPKQGHH